MCPGKAAPVPGAAAVAGVRSPWSTRHVWRARAAVSKEVFLEPGEEDGQRVVTSFPCLQSVTVGNGAKNFPVRWKNLNPFALRILGFSTW